MSQMDSAAPRRLGKALLAAPVLALGLYAAPAAAQDSTQVTTDTAAYAPATAERVVPNQISVELMSVASSGITGTAVLAPEGDDDTGTDVEITLRDSAGNEREYDVTLRAGTCAEPGEVIEKIDDTEADGDPEDEGVDLRLAAILGSPHIIHVTQEGGDAAVACGEIAAAK